MSGASVKRPSSSMSLRGSGVRSPGGMSSGTPRSVPGGAARAARLEALAERERLKGSLVVKLQQLHAKSGRPISQGTLNKQVASLLASGGKVTEADMARLEPSLDRLSMRSDAGARSSAGSRRSTASRASSVCGTRDTRSSHKASSPAAAAATAAVSAGMPVSVSADEFRNDEWAAIQRYLNAKADREIDADVQRQRQAKVDLKRRLDEQLAEQAALHESEARKEREWLDLELQRIEQMRREDRAAAAARQAMEKQQKEERDAQLAQLAEKRAQEAAEKKAQEQRIVASVRKALQREQAYKRQRRERERERYEAMMRENDEAQAVKEAMKKRAMDEDIRALQAYIELNDRQEAARQQALANLYARQEQRMHHFDLVVGKSLQERMKEDEARAQREQDEYDRKRAAEDEARKRKAEQDLVETKRVLAQQLAEKAARSEAEQAEHKRTLAHWLEEKAEVEREKAAARDQVRLGKLAQRKALQEQIQEVQARKKLEARAMNETERRMNADLLAKVKAAKLDDASRVASRRVSSNPHQDSLYQSPIALEL